MNIFKNFLYNTVYQVLLILLPLVTMPYISRVLGPDGLGKYAYTNSIISYFVLFGGLGISVYGSRQIAYVQNFKSKRSAIFWNITIIKIITTIISICVLILFLLISHKYKILIIAQSFTLIATFFDVSWYFVGVEDFKKIIVRNIIVKLTSLALVFTMVKSKEDIIIYALIISFSNLISNITLIPFLKKQIYFLKFYQVNIFPHVIPIILLFVPQFTSQIYLVLNKTMLGKMDSITAVGFFNSSDTIIRLALTIVTSLSSVLMPRISSLIMQGNNKSISVYMDKSFQFINFLAFPIVAGLAAIAPKFIPLFLGEGFETVIDLLIMESPIILFISWSVAITNQYLIPSCLNKEYLWSTFLGAVVNILLNVVLIPFHGVYGAMISTIFSEMIVTIYLFYSIRKKLNVKQMMTFNLGKYLIGSAVMYASVSFLDKIFAKNFIAILLEVAVGIVIYITVLIVLKTDIVLKWRNFFD